MSFVHLHVHTEYSLLDGFSQIKKLIRRAKEMGMPAVAITDHGSMFGVIDFFNAARAAGVKPLIGLEAYLAARGMQDHDARLDKQSSHLLLLAENQAGYQNLLKIASAAQLDGFYYHPRIDHEFLAAHADGLIATSGCLAAEIPRALRDGDLESARKKIDWYYQVFGKDRFFLELQDHNIPELKTVNRALLELAPHYQARFVATNDVHYVEPEDYRFQDILLAIQTGALLSDPNRFRMDQRSYYLRSPQEMADLFREVPQAISNTLLVAERCNVDLSSEGYHLPVFDVPEGYTTETYLRSLCEEGLRRRYGERADSSEVRERLEYELKTIHEMGFDAYFLIVWDLCRHAAERGIWYNARGSAAGSLVAYSLDITLVDPLEHGLIFERFLNTGRITMPDIDMDFQDDMRASLMEYCAAKYGDDKVAQIITFGTLGARAAVRDVARVMDIPLSEVDRVAKLIPGFSGKAVSLPEAVEQVPELKALYQETGYLRELIDTAAQMEGVVRNAGTHAAGVVITDRPMVEYIPLHRPTSGAEDGPIKVITQFEMSVIESLGLLKVDFLGLITLTIMNRACKLIAERHGRRFDLNNIPVDDPEVFQFLSEGRTAGVFQLEGSGMTRFLMQMKPRNLANIIAMVALYRPGPMEFIPSYIRRMHAEEEITYRHPELEPIFKETFGIPIYQEQIMSAAIQLADYTPSESDDLRRAIAKKKSEAIERHRGKFIQGAVGHGIPEEIAERIFQDWENFARYGFNKCLPGDVEVVDAHTGRLVRIEDLYRQTARLDETLTCDTAALRLQNGPVARVMANGLKRVYRLVTASGRSIEATDNHPFYTPDGWQPLGRLRPGSLVAVPRSIPCEGRRVWPDHEVSALAQALVETGRSQPHCGSLAQGRGSAGRVENLPCAATLQELPAEVFELNNRQLGLLAGHLWAGAGHIDRPNRRLFYPAPSERLARQLQHLLLRLGVFSTLRLSEEGGDGLCRLFVAGSENLERFAAHLPAPARAALRQALPCEPLSTITLYPDDPRLRREAEADIYWDPVVSIEPAGEKQTYDLQVPGTHNFVANDILVHNSHAADYGVIAVQTAYLKTHYTIEYMTALLSAEKNNNDKVAFYVADCRSMGIDVLPPDVNASDWDFSIEDRPEQQPAIRFGMGAVKNVGQAPVDLILEARKEGPFRDLNDFAHRVDLRQVGKRSLESLVRVGAMDSFGPRRALCQALDQILAVSASHFRAVQSGQMSFFSMVGGMDAEIHLPGVYDLDSREQLEWERELLGLYVSDHPLTPYLPLLKRKITHFSAELGEARSKERVIVAGMVTRMRNHQTKTGKPMGFATLEDIQGNIELILFPRTWEQFGELVVIDQVLVVEGRVDAESGDAKVLVDRVMAQSLEDLPSDPDLPPLSIDSGYPSAGDVSAAGEENGQDAGDDPDGELEDEEDRPLMALHELRPPADGTPPAAGDDPYDDFSPPEPDDWHLMPEPLDLLPLFGGAVSTPPPALQEQPEARRQKPAPANEALEVQGFSLSAPAAQLFASPAGVRVVGEVEKKETEPRMITVVLRPLGDKNRDVRRLKRIYGKLRSSPGRDRFAVRLFEQNYSYLIQFPNETTGISSELVRQLVELVGESNVLVRPIQVQ